MQLRLADMVMRVEASRLLIWRAISRSDAEGLPSPADASLAKCFANEMTRKVCGSAVQLMGGYGYHREYGAKQRFRDAWGWGIAGGAIDIQKVNIATALLGRRFNQRAWAMTDDNRRADGELPLWHYGALRSGLRNPGGAQSRSALFRDLRL